MWEGSGHQRAHCRIYLLRAHPILPVILSKLFQLSLLYKRVPTGFGCSYIVPLPKSNDSISKAESCEYFRVIAICPIISKLFEYRFIEKYGEYLSTDNKQFGFKKGLDCNHAIYTVERVVDRFIKGEIQLICSLLISAKLSIRRITMPYS